MRQPLFPLIKIEKLFHLKKSMTESSKNACLLLLSVILLAGTVTGIAGPLENRVRQMTEQTGFMRKELVLYRQFAEDQNRAEKQVRRWDLLQKLRGQLPGKIDPETEMQRIYRLAARHGIAIEKCKQITDASANFDKTGNTVTRLLWETEFYGDWQDLLNFFGNIENQGPCTRMEALQIRKSDGKGLTFSGNEGCMKLSVSGKICVYWCKKRDAKRI